MMSGITKVGKFFSLSWPGFRFRKTLKFDWDVPNAFNQASLPGSSDLQRPEQKFPGVEPHLFYRAWSGSGNHWQGCSRQMNWDSWLLFAKDLTSCYDSKPSTGNKEKFGRDLQSPFHLVLNISHQRREELSSLGCLGVTKSQGRETLRWDISERNHFRSLFMQLGCRRLREPPLSYPACAAASSLSTSGPWGLDHAGICQVCALHLESRNLGFCFSCTVHSTQPSAEVLSVLPWKLMRSSPESSWGSDSRRGSHTDTPVPCKVGSRTPNSATETGTRL